MSDQPGTDAAQALRAAARFGPYFAWEQCEPREPRDGGPGWRPLGDLLEAEVVANRVAVGRQGLARMARLSPDDIGERVAASIVFLGLVSRLLSPLLAAAAVGGALPLPDIERMWWRPVDSGPMPIAWRGLVAVSAVGAEGDPAAVARVLTSSATCGLVEPVLEVFRHRFTLSRHVLWGNVASALGGAAGVIADAAPAYAKRSAAVVEQALAIPPLLGTATLARPDPARERWFLVRRNCCLYYRIPGGGMCGDCVLTPDAVRRRQWRAVLGR